ncbi:MAG: hypothetical protein Q9226_007519 [Calogaya cf. arnoldii]
MPASRKDSNTLDIEDPKYFYLNPRSRRDSKLRKNPNHLRDVAEHLRPRGSYDPLPPPGGFRLPHYIRRKFSFAPQLPNVSKISLMPDFASSSLDLGIEIDESEARQISHDTPVSLWVRYSLESLRERHTRDQQIRSKPSLPRLNTNLPYSNKVGRYDSGVATNTRSYDPHEPPYPELRHSHSIRRSRGQEFLRQQRISTASSACSELSSECDTLGFNTQSSTTMTPRTALNPVDAKVYGLANTDEVESRLLRRMAKMVPNLLGSFCIIDLQLPGYPIRVTSQDMLPADLAPDEVLFLDSSHMGTPYQVETVSSGNQKLQILPIVVDLVDVRGSSAQPSHLVVGQVDLTDFVCSQPELDEDVWLAIAYEEMDKLRIRQTYPRPTSYSRNPILADSKGEQGIEMIRSLHRDYFIIGISDAKTREFGITMVSPTLYASKEVRGKDFLDLARINDQLNTPQHFVTRVKWNTTGQRDKLYCVPITWLNGSLSQENYNIKDAVDMGRLGGTIANLMDLVRKGHVQGEGTFTAKDVVTKFMNLINSDAVWSFVLILIPEFRVPITETEQSVDLTKDPNKQLGYVLRPMDKADRLSKPQRTQPYFNTEWTLMREHHQRCLEYLETGGLGRDEGTPEQLARAKDLGWRFDGGTKAAATGQLPGSTTSPQQASSRRSSAAAAMGKAFEAGQATGNSQRGPPPDI